jgi:hypothetical protein
MVSFNNISRIMGVAWLEFYRGRGFRGTVPQKLSTFFLNNPLVVIPVENKKKTHLNQKYDKVLKPYNLLLCSSSEAILNIDK